jgi:hypothetical protein
VIAALDDKDEIVDFGAVEVQAVYISGNVSKVFQEYMKNPAANYAIDWPSKNYPNPDYLSSSRKRLAPQLIYKGGILHKWGKKMVVVVHQGFFDQLPRLKQVRESNAEIAWMIYDFQHDKANNRYMLERKDVKYKVRECTDYNHNAHRRRYGRVPEISERENQTGQSHGFSISI